MTDNVYLLPDERMSKWLQTREHLYSNLDYGEITPLAIPSVVKEKLNAEGGTPTQVLENTPYPTWNLKQTKYYKLENVRDLLTNYSLTAYKGLGSIIITPKVPKTMIEKLNHELHIMGKEDYHTPCFFWSTNLEPKDANKLLVKVRKLLEEFPVVPYLDCDITSRPSEQWSTELETVEEYGLTCNIAVAPTTNKFDIMRFYQVDGANYGLNTEEIIKELMLLDMHYGIDFIGPAEVQLRRVPEGDELQELEEWFRGFCPDLAYDGKTVTALAKGRISLWWD